MSEQDYLSSIRELIKSELIDVNTSISGEIVSYAGGFATIRPLATKSFKDGDSLPYPLIYKVPVRWPSFNAGQCGFKAPIKTGDKVIVIFSQQAADGSDDLRRFDLTDAYAIPASNETSSGGGNNDDTIMFFGSASIKITASGKVIITAPGGITYEAPTNQYTGSQDTVGTIAGHSGFTIEGGTGATVAISGSISNNGVNIGSTHVHSDPQGGNVSPPF